MLDAGISSPESGKHTEENPPEDTSDDREDDERGNSCDRPLHHEPHHRSEWHVDVRHHDARFHFIRHVDLLSTQASNGRAFSGEPSERSERPERMRGRRVRCNAMLGARGRVSRLAAEADIASRPPDCPQARGRYLDPSRGESYLHAHCPSLSMSTLKRPSTE